MSFLHGDDMKSARRAKKHLTSVQQNLIFLYGSFQTKIPFFFFGALFVTADFFLHILIGTLS